mgnify:CR=1 FL=1
MICLPNKPKFASPCNGCGLCCAKEICEVGAIAFPGAQAPCPALKINSERTQTYCELVAIEIFAGLEPIIQNGLGIGAGCTMNDC